ncbi:nucleoside deaminase [Thermodesulfobacteriota bacterium]
MQKTHEHFMQEAIKEARQSLDAGDFPVGCVLVSEGKIISRGRRIHTLQPDNTPPSCMPNELDHAEIIALRELRDSHPDTDPAGVVVYSTMEPCLMCYATLLLNNIHTIVYAYEDAMGGGTTLPLSRLTPLYRQMNPTIIPGILRDESLSLFKQFFTTPGLDYWKGSLLAEYTLAQSQGPT